MATQVEGSQLAWRMFTSGGGGGGGGARLTFDSSPSFTDTPPTRTYTAPANKIVPVDASAQPTTVVTLPSAASSPDGTLVGVFVAARGSNVLRIDAPGDTIIGFDGSPYAGSYSPPPENMPAGAIAVYMNALPGTAVPSPTWFPIQDWATGLGLQDGWPGVLAINRLTGGHNPELTPGDRFNAASREFAPEIKGSSHVMGASGEIASSGSITPYLTPDIIAEANPSSIYTIAAVEVLGVVMGQVTGIGNPSFYIREAWSLTPTGGSVVSATSIREGTASFPSSSQFYTTLVADSSGKLRLQFNDSSVSNELIEFMFQARVTELDRAAA